MIARSSAIPLSQHTQQRLLEILPGALTWFALLVPVVVAFAIRLNDPGMLWILGVGAVLLDAYWLVRTTVTVRCVRRTMGALQANDRIDWWQRCEEFEASLPEGAPAPSEIVQCALIPTYTESYEVLRATVAALAAQNYPEQLRVCAIITRETDAGGIENVRPPARGVRRQVPRRSCTSAIRCCRASWSGKSAAMAYGGPVLKAACDELGLDPTRTLVTDLDSDFRLHPQYFAYITLQFCTRRGPAPVDLAAGAGVSQQPLARADRGPRDGDRRDAVADVPASEPAPPDHVLVVHAVAGPARRRRLLGLRRDPGGLAILLEDASSTAAASSICAPRSSPSTATRRVRAVTPRPTRRSTTRSSGGPGERPISLM